MLGGAMGGASIPNLPGGQGGGTRNNMSSPASPIVIQTLDSGSVERFFTSARGRRTLRTIGKTGVY